MSNLSSSLICEPPQNSAQIENQPASFMQQALALGRLARGRCSPNPAVGAVIVNAQGQIAGEGYTQPPGQAHAEIMALQQAGEQAQGATLYVTLEPCAAQGRTPPCVEAIIRAGVQRVYYATSDPNPQMQGGAALLQQAGIEVIGGLLSAEAAQAHAAFFHWLRTGRPYLVVKYAMTLDGKIAAHTGDSRWITGSPARQLVHILRDECDAVLVGINTVLADDPALTVRLTDFADLPTPQFTSAIARKPRQPLRVVVDSRGKIPLTAQLVRPGTLLATTANIALTKQTALLERGVEVLICPTDSTGQVSLPALLEKLGQRGLLQVLIEGGSSLLASFLLGSAMVRPNKVWAFIAPKLVGGANAPAPVGGVGYAQMSQALELEQVNWHSVGQDLLVEGYLATNSDSSSN